MSGQTRSLWFELTDRDQFVTYMDHRDETVRSLAAKAIVRGADGRPKSLSPAMIGHLRSGARRTCSPATAKAVEQALNVPLGFFFAPRTTRRPEQQEVNAA